jgi:hypothetical protein
MMKFIGKWSRAGVLLLSMVALTASPVVAQKKQLLEYPSIHSPVVGEQGMVVSQNAIASEVGADILRGGGNAVDAAVAIGFALAVTLPRAGNIGGDGFSVAGNMLAGGAVVQASFDSFRANPGLALPERLITALDAGEAMGGDKRGRQSAALVLTTTEDFPDINLRVDDHAAPLAELRRLLGLWRIQAEPGLASRPSKANPSGETDLDVIEAAWIARGMDLRLRRP